MATLEETVRKEQEEFETEKTASPTDEPREPIEAPADGTFTELPAGDGKQLFDDTDYEREDLAIPKIDGNGIDRIAIGFSGTVFLDRSDPADVALFNRLRLGHDVTLMVEGKCSQTGAKGATDREGDLDVTIGQRNVKVSTVYVPAGG